MKTVFNIDTNKDFPAPFMDIIDKKCNQIDPVTAIVGTQFKANRNISFAFTQSYNQWISFRESFLSIKVTAKLTGGGGGPLDNTLTLNFNPGSCLFSKDNHTINGTTVSSCANVPQAEAYWWRQIANEYKNTVGSCSYLDDRSTRSLRTTGKEVHEFTWTPISLSTFRNESLFAPGNLKHKINFEVANNWEAKVLESIGTLGVFANTGGYTISIDEVIFNLVSYYGPDQSTLANKTLYYDTSNLITSHFPLSTSLAQHITTNVTDGLYRIAFWLQKTVINDTTNSVVRFKSHDGTNHLEHRLSGYQFILGSKNYPSQKAVLDLNSPTSLTIMKVYRETLNAITAFDNSCGNETFQEYYGERGLYYVSNTVRDMSENASNLSLYLDFNADPSGMSVYILQESTSIVGVKYDSDGVAKVVSLVENGGVIS